MSECGVETGLNFVLPPDPIRVSTRELASCTEPNILSYAVDRWLQNDSFNALNQRADKLFEEGTYQDAMPLQEKAVHKFFASEDESDKRATEVQPLRFQASVFRSKFFKNPMHRSGLALAGAQATLKAWKNGEVPLAENDGIVTAEDVSTLD